MCSYPSVVCLTRRKSCFASACFSFFLVLFVQPSRETLRQFVHSFWFVEHVRDQSESLPCLCRSGTEFILNHDRLCHIWCFVICAQIEKCRQVFFGVHRTRCKSCPSVSPSGKVLRVVASIHTSSVGVVLPGYFAPCPLGKFSQELKFVPRICALSAVRDLLIGNLRVLWKAVRYRVRHIW